MKILLVAGHGQGDVGAVGNGFKEADLTREFVNLLVPHLKWNASAQIDVYDTSKDMFRNNPLNGYDEVIEFHFNAASPAAHGTEILISKGTKPDSIDDAILGALSKYFTNRGFKYRNDLKNMNHYASKGVAYRLVEICFISNSNDMAIYNNNKDAIAREMAINLRPLIGFNENATPAQPTTPVAPTTTSLTPGKYKVVVDKLNVRVQPNTGAQIVASYKAGNTVVVNKIIENNGYFWGEYTGGSSGKLRYVALKPINGNNYAIKI